MSIEKGDPCQALSRRMQDFHEADPATQAALSGETYFEVTGGHLLSSALETDYFETVDECLEFFGLDREVLTRRTPFTRHEIKEIEDRIYADTDERLREGESAPYEAWAEWFIATNSIEGKDRTEVAEALLGSATSDVPTKDTAAYAEEVSDRNLWSWGVYHHQIFRLQAHRLLDLVAQEGFAVSVAVAAQSFIASGLLQAGDKREIKWDIEELQQRLAAAAHVGLRQEVVDGVVDLSDFDEVDWEEPFEKMDYEEFGEWAIKGDLVVLSAKDLRLFASHYAAPDEIRGFSSDEKYQRLMRLIKNTPERIAEVQDHIAFLRKPRTPESV